MDDVTLDSIRQGVIGVEIDGNGLGVLLEELLEQEPGDITTLAAVRYLFHKRLWDGTQPLAPDVIAKFYTPEGFGNRTAEEYRTLTGVAILTDYGYEMPEYVPYVPEPRPERPQRDGKAKRKPKQQAVERHESRNGEHIVTDLTEGESGSRTFKSLAEHDSVDTTGASDRLKKVIGIQRKG